MFVEQPLPEPDPDQDAAQSQNHQEAEESPPDASTSPAMEAIDDNDVSDASTGSDEPVDEGVSELTRKWVDEQKPKYKTGNMILSRARNKNRKDLDAIKLYVDELVAAGTIPMSGKKAPAAKVKGVVASPPSAKSLATFPREPKEAVEVLISEIRMNAQIRVKNLDEANVLRIMENFDASDPVDLFKRPEGENELANGHHRVEAATRLGKPTIKAYIHEGSMCDALIFAYRTNDRNGIPLTKADRKNALIMIRATPEGAKLKAEQIADQLGVTRQTIQTYLAEIRDGKSADAKKRAPVDKVALQKKAVATLTRIEGRFGLAVFRDFVVSLDDEKRAELRALLDGDAE